MAEKLLIFGPPGSGKGTQAAIIGQSRQLAHVSTGDMLRAAMAAGTELGKRVKDVVDRGDLVTDDLMLALVEDRLEQADAKGGFLLDGFPRTLAQAEGLARVLTKAGTHLDAVIILDVDDDELVKRAMARGRADDSEKTVQHRLDVYRGQTEPVLGFFEGKVRFCRVDGVGNIEEITERIERGLDAEHQY